jgi:stearoyl-CoA desaturase (delta-9 desaturase)
MYTVIAGKKDWTSIAFLSLTPIIGVAGTAVYTWHSGFHLWMALLLLGMYLLVGMSICAGYHRYFSHKSYECSPILQALYAFFGAMALQNSILRWSAGHRFHHAKVDSDWDPYSIKRGFWWAHILWIFEVTEFDLENVRDLKANPIAQWQHRWYKAIGLIAGFGIPTLIGMFFGNPIAGLLWGGFLRVVIIHHTTFFVNSLAHAMGSQEFDSDVSARDNWMVALVTLGEGYHSFHHRFPSDFRNGTRWYHWDPAKWFIRAMRCVGLASDLRATPQPQIEHIRLQVALKKFEFQLQEVEPAHGAQIRQRLNMALTKLEKAIALWRQQAAERAQDASSAWKTKRKHSLRMMRHAHKDWKRALRMLSRVPT